MAYRPLWQSLASAPRGGRGLVLAINKALEDLWNYVAGGGWYGWGTAKAVTLASGVLVMTTGYLYYTVSSETGVTDLLTSISGLVAGEEMLVRAATGHTITVVAGASLKMPVDFVMNSPNDTIRFLGNGGGVAVEVMRNSAPA